MARSGQSALTLRQIEVIRAVMIAGSITGASKLLNVSQPGISRTMKHIEISLGVTLFTRSGGRYVPTPAANRVFLQLEEIDQKLRDLNTAIGQLERGELVELAMGSVPSIANVMVPRAVRRFKHRYPGIHMRIELLKIEEAIDFLLLGKGELVCMSYRFDHPSLVFEPLATGHLVCVVHRDHPLATLDEVSAEQIAEHPLIGIDPQDPYGGLLVEIFDALGLDYRIEIDVRFGTTVLALLRQNLGVAVLDCFTVDGLEQDDATLRTIPIREPTRFSTYVARRSDVEMSSFALDFVQLLRREMSDPL